MKTGPFTTPQIAQVQTTAQQRCVQLAEQSVDLRAVLDNCAMKCVCSADGLSVVLTLKGREPGTFLLELAQIVGQFVARPTQTGFTLTEVLADGTEGEAVEFAWSAEIRATASYDLAYAKILVRRETGSEEPILSDGEFLIQSGRRFRVFGEGDDLTILEFRKAPDTCP